MFINLRKEFICFLNFEIKGFAQRSITFPKLERDPTYDIFPKSKKKVKKVIPYKFKIPEWPVKLFLLRLGHNLADYSDKFKDLDELFKMEHVF